LQVIISLATGAQAAAAFHEDLASLVHLGATLDAADIKQALPCLLQLYPAAASLKQCSTMVLNNRAVLFTKGNADCSTQHASWHHHQQRWQFRGTYNTHQGGPSSAANQPQ
jgi:hypothetical protein